MALGSILAFAFLCLVVSIGYLLRLQMTIVGFEFLVSSAFAALFIVALV
jgi:hypothetical protein